MLRQRSSGGRLRLDAAPGDSRCLVDASALGVTDGPVVAEIVMHQGVPHVAEISARLGVAAFLDAATCLALGEEILPNQLQF